MSLAKMELWVSLAVASKLGNFFVQVCYCTADARWPHIPGVKVYNFGRLSILLIEQTLCPEAPMPPPDSERGD